MNGFLLCEGFSPSYRQSTIPPTISTSNIQHTHAHAMSPELTTLGASSVCITKISDHEMSDDTAERMSKLGPLPSRNAKPVKTAMRTAVDFVARDKPAALGSWFLRDKESYADTSQSYRGLFPGKLDDVLPYSEFEYLPNADPSRIMTIESLIDPEERVDAHRLYWDVCLINEATARKKEQGTSIAGVEGAGDTQITHQREPACQSLARMTKNDESVHKPDSDTIPAMSPMGTMVHERQEEEEEDSDDESLPPGLEDDDGDFSDSDGEEMNLEPAVS